jgi:hypothetical protein
MGLPLIVTSATDFAWGYACMTSAKLNLSHGVFTAICLVALVGCSWIPPEDPLFRKLIVLAQDNHDRHDLLSSGETLDLEATVNSLIQEGFSPDFAELPFATYQNVDRS